MTVRYSYNPDNHPRGLPFLEIMVFTFFVFIKFTWVKLVWPKISFGYWDDLKKSIKIVVTIIWEIFLMASVVGGSYNIYQLWNERPDFITFSCETSFMVLSTSFITKFCLLIVRFVDRESDWNPWTFVILSVLLFTASPFIVSVFYVFVLMVIGTTHCYLQVFIMLVFWSSFKKLEDSDWVQIIVTCALLSVPYSMNVTGYCTPKTSYYESFQLYNGGITINEYYSQRWDSFYIIYMKLIGLI